MSIMMIDREDVGHLAALARVAVPDDEKELLAKELGAILGYVSELETIVIGDPVPEAGPLRNVMREDGDPVASASVQGIVSNMPETEDGYLKVRAIFTDENA